VEAIKMANQEAARLAEATDNRGSRAREPEKKAKFLRVRVVEDGHPTVNVKVPIGVARWGMKMAQAFSPEMKDANLDWDSITAIIQEGEQRKIVEVEDDHKTVRSGWNDRHSQRVIGHRAWPPAPEARATPAAAGIKRRRGSGFGPGRPGR
jgi:hypothetical protein